MECEVIVLTSDSDGCDDVSDCDDNETAVKSIDGWSGEKDDVVDLCGSDSDVESVSGQEIPKIGEEEVEYFEEDKDLPMWIAHPKTLSSHEILRAILFDKERIKPWICKKRPLNVNRNATFIVDLSYLSSKRNVFADDMGVWKHTGSPSQYYQIFMNEYGGLREIVSMGKKCTTMCEDMYRIKKNYSCHHAASDLSRTVIFVEDHKGNINDMCIVQYSFRFGEHDIKICPHGNSRSSEPYIRTKPSTLKAIKEERMACCNSTPKSVVARITKKEGGIINCESQSSLPRNRHQVSNAGQGSSKGTNTDLMYAVMEMCLKAKSGGERFVRVQAAPEPMAVLALKQHLVDIERFCTNDQNFSIVGFDPTFNCGKFAVTVMVYKNLLLQNYRDGSIPTFLGPLLVHQRKLKESYHYLMSTLIGLHPPLSRIRAIGTDGEINLFKAILTCLPLAQHVRCAFHMCRDIERKFGEMGVPKAYQGHFVKDVMGSFYSPGTVGLVDAQSESEFDDELARLKGVWDEREAEFSSCRPRLHSWLCKYHAQDIRNSMIVPVREKAGLGHPPQHYTTNSNESMNKVIKEALHYEEKNWDKFCDEMLALVKIQYQELEKCVVCCGEYRFRPQFSYLQVPTSRWNKMSVKQREQHMKVVMNVTIDSGSEQSQSSSGIAMIDGHPKPSQFSTATNPTTTTNECQPASSQAGAVEVRNVSDIPAPATIPNDVWDRCLVKVKSLHANPASMSSLPGGNSRSKFVAWSGNPESPIKVQAGKFSGKYTCNKMKCPMFAGYNLCAHILAVAIQNGDSDDLLEKYAREKRGPKVTDLAMMGMPKNSGKKPSGSIRPRKKRSRLASPSVSEVKKAHLDSGKVPSFQPQTENTSPNLHSPSKKAATFEQMYPAALDSLQPQNVTTVPSLASVSGPPRQTSPGSTFPYYSTIPTTSVASPAKDQASLMSSYSPALPCSAANLFQEQPSSEPSSLLDLSSALPDGAAATAPAATAPAALPKGMSSVSNPQSTFSQNQNMPLVLNSLSGTTQNQTQQLVSCSVVVTQPSATYAMSPFNRGQQLPYSSISPVPLKPFFVKFLTKQIKVCQGCRGGYYRNFDGSSLPPPYDIIIGHFDQQEFQDRLTGLNCLSRETCLHFHAYLPCILARYPTFQPSLNLQVPPAVERKLQGIHKQFIHDNFGILL